MQPWFKIATPRKEVRAGRSFNPDEFAIALEQVVDGNAPEDYKDAKKFFARTYPTQALRRHVGMVLRRLSGKTENTAPVLTLVTQFGGGKTHILAALYHLAKAGKAGRTFIGVPEILKEAGLADTPKANVAVFVGNAWDPKDGRETPWIDLAYCLAGAKGVALLGKDARKSPPGTKAISELFKASGGSVLLLFDEVLNFVNRHRGMAEPFHAFIQNLTVAMTGTEHSAAVISLPRSQVEMTDWDHAWQEKITKVVRRVAKDLIANDESEISEVVRRRLFEDLGPEKIRKEAAKAYADWCFERRNQLPSAWTGVDTAATDAKAREFLRARFEACYPFHPATLSVFQRKWQALAQYQQTRGTLAMLAQWVAWAYREAFEVARNEAFISLGSAPLANAEFRSSILGQLGEGRLDTAIEVDLAGPQAHANTLDADTKGALKGIHRRVGSAILFESSGGQADKTAHLPELRFAIGEPGLDTTTIDTAANALESKAFFIRKAGTDGFRIYHKATLRKAVNDRKASLTDEEIQEAAESLVKEEFKSGAAMATTFFPDDSSAVSDSPRLTLVVMDPGVEWGAPVRKQLAGWTRERGQSPRLFPGAIIWCVKKPGRDLIEKVETWLAWKRVAKDVKDGNLGTDFDKTDRTDIEARIAEAEEAARDEVWGGYRYGILSDPQEKDGLRELDLGAGHSSGPQSQAGRVLEALKHEGLLNEGIGASFLQRKWPQAFKQSGAWPLAVLRQSFLNGSLPRLMDPDETLRSKVMEFVRNGDFGFAAGHRSDTEYEQVWYLERVSPDDISFDLDVYLLAKERAKSLKSGGGKEATMAPAEASSEPEPQEEPQSQGAGDGLGGTVATSKILRVVGTIPPELWNRLGTKLLPKLRQGTGLTVGVDFSVEMDAGQARAVEEDLRQILGDLGLSDKIRIE